MLVQPCPVTLSMQFIMQTPVDTDMLISYLAAGELLHMAEPFLEKNLHPTVIVKGYARVCAAPILRPAGSGG